jgi:hypothetical protein
MFPLVFGFGVKHAFDIDHVLVVSNFTLRSKIAISKIIASWIAGHLLTVTMIVLFAHFSFWNSETLLSWTGEWLVGAALVLLGAFAFLTEICGVGLGWCAHSKGERIFPELEHINARLFAMGAVQGMASNDELFSFLVVSLGFTDAVWLFFGVLIYGLGILTGMLTFVYALTGFLKRFKDDMFRLVVRLLIATCSVAYGLVVALG